MRPLLTLNSGAHLLKHVKLNAIENDYQHQPYLQLHIVDLHQVNLTFDPAEAQRSLSLWTTHYL